MKITIFKIIDSKVLRIEKIHYNYEHDYKRRFLENYQRKTVKN